MAMENGQFGGGTEVRDDFVPAVFARARGEAEVYSEILNERNIPTIIGGDYAFDDDVSAPDHRGGCITNGVPVLVPETLLDEAGAVIADRDNLADYDLEEDMDIEDDDFDHDDLSLLDLDDDDFDDDDGNLLDDDDEFDDDGNLLDDDDDDDEF